MSTNQKLIYVFSSEAEAKAFSAGIEVADAAGLSVLDLYPRVDFWVVILEEVAAERYTTTI